MQKLKQEMETADAIVIGTGAGLSSSAGMSYDGERFEKNFADFHMKYGIRDMYSGGFYPYDTLEEYWAWRSRQIMVITINVDHQFQLAGFDKKRLFYTQGDYGLWQCSKPCHQRTYDNEGMVRKMAAEQKDMKIPSKLIPQCPVCGAPMTMNLRCDKTFVQDDGWYAAFHRYNDFIRRHEGKHILFLELGVGANTPVLCVLSASLKPKTITIKQQILCQFVNNSNTKERRCA